MRISKIVCDGCGKEITGNPINVYAETLDRETGDFCDEKSTWNADKDFCEDCLERIKDFIQHMNKNAVSEDAPEEPKREAEIVENKKNNKPKKLKEQNKKPTVKELIIAGVEKTDVIRRTGCNPHSYDNTKSKLKKQGLLKEGINVKPVKCSEKGKQCQYSANVGGGTIICDYLGKVGYSRGCDPEKCDKFEKR